MLFQHNNNTLGHLHQYNSAYTANYSISNVLLFILEIHRISTYQSRILFFFCVTFSQPTYCLANQVCRRRRRRIVHEIDGNQTCSSYSFQAKLCLDVQSPPVYELCSLTMMDALKVSGNICKTKK